MEHLYTLVSAAGRPVDAIALNAGVGAGGGFVGGTELQDELQVIDLNVKSIVHLAKRVLPDMVRRGEGRVLGRRQRQDCRNLVAPTRATGCTASSRMNWFRVSRHAQHSRTRGTSSRP